VIVTVRDQEWVHEAACRGSDIELWFDPNRVKEAKRICSSCPVRAECLESALQDESRWHFKSFKYGVRGGMTGEERERMPVYEWAARGVRR
jgi:WhiB family redox-sensing transcriptional regulator